MLDWGTIQSSAEKVFFEAMLDGWVGGENKKSIITESPDGYTTFEFTSGCFRVADRYCTTRHSTYSAGTTTIFYQNNPVWWMSYGGFYPEHLIPFLWKALKQQYDKRVFRGGRGPASLVFEDYLYLNSRVSGNFTKFKGREEIIDMRNGSLSGYHEYWGMSLI